MWNKYKEDSYHEPDVVADGLKLRKHSCFLRRASSGFYSTGSLYSVEDISHPIGSGELSEEARKYVEDWEYPVRWECFSLTELEAYADKCREKVYSELADAFHACLPLCLSSTIGRSRMPRPRERCFRWQVADCS